MKEHNNSARIHSLSPESSEKDHVLAHSGFDSTSGAPAVPPPPFQLKASRNSGGKKGPSRNSARKFERKFRKWKQKHQMELAGLSEAEVYERFANSKTAFGKLRKETKWFKAYESGSGVSTATGWDVQAEGWKQEQSEGPREDTDTPDQTSNSIDSEDLIEDQEIIADEPETITLANGETIEEGVHPQETIDRFNSLYERAVANGHTVTSDVWSFQNHLDGESMVGNYVANYIQNLDDAPADYQVPATFALSGVQPTYDAATEYRNPRGNCYSTSAARINKGYEDMFGETPIDYSQNARGEFTTADYQTASTQSGCENFGYGVGGALANGGEGATVDNEGVWAGELKPGAALQIWYTNDPEMIGRTSGHSQIFIDYQYEDGEISGLQVYDNSGALEILSRSVYENNRIILAGNLIDQ